jgi:transposase
VIGMFKLNDINPEAWVADVLRRINDHPASKLDELLSWHWACSLVPGSTPPDEIVWRPLRRDSTA